MSEINTKYFGTLSYEQDELVNLAQGVFGFTELREFLIIRFDNDSDAMLCLQSVEKSDVAFVMINPFVFMPDYSPEPSMADISAVSASEGGELSYYVICVIADEMLQSTANLLCPIIVNPLNRQARQVILEGSSYQMRTAFSEFMNGEG